MTRPRRKTLNDSVQHTGLATGFSLLEIIVVLSLLAVISAAIVPVFSSSLTGLKHDNALRNLASLIQFVQEKSVSESRVYRVCFDTDEQSFWVMQPAENPTEEAAFEMVLEPYGRRRKLPSGMEFDRLRARTDREGDYEYIECYPNGASDQLTISFDFPRDRGRSAKIVLEGVMGRVETEE